MKKILILKGVSNTGKTTKINTIAKWIMNTYGAPNTIGLDPNNLLKNTLGILTVKNFRIGINSAGDSLKCVKKTEAIEQNYDILICCCRTRGITYQYFYKNYKRSNGWIDIYLNCEQYSSNAVKQQHLRDSTILNELKVHLIGLQKI